MMMMLMMIMMVFSTAIGPHVDDDGFQHGSWTTC